jgi:hypothetical protein
VRRGAIALGFSLLSLALVRCGGDSDTTCGPKPIYPCAQCGSDFLDQAECVDGNWTCPGNMMFTNECPDGTCFGPPVSCCGPNGKKSAGICHVSEQSPAPSGGPCPADWVPCYTLYDAGPLGPDAGSSVEDCLAKNNGCAFCCGNFFGDGRKEVVISVTQCMCDGPCATACVGGLYCLSPSDPSAPSDDCLACIVEQLQPGDSCTSEACTSPDCTSYLECLNGCLP